MATVEIDTADLTEHEGHHLTVEVDDTVRLICKDCGHKVIAEYECPTFRATVRLSGTAYITRQCRSEERMREIVEDLYFPDDADEMDLDVDDIEIEED